MHRLLGSRLEMAFSAGLVAWGLAEAAFIPSDWPTAVRVLVALAATLPLALRHRFPIPIAAWAAVLLLVDSLVVFLPYEAVTPLQGVAVGIFAIAAYVQPGRRAALALSAVLPFSAFFFSFEHEVPLILHDFLAFTAMELLALAGGLAVRRRREALERDEVRAADAGAERAQRLTAALAAERRRIARELHAIVTRDLGRAAALAGAARAALPADGRRAGDALAEVSRTSSAALEELRRLLGVLRAEEESAAVAARGAGLALADAEARSGGSAASAPAGDDASAGAEPASSGGARPLARRALALRPTGADVVTGLFALAALVVEQRAYDRGLAGWASGGLLIVAPLLLLRTRAATACAALVAAGLVLRLATGWSPSAGQTVSAVLVLAPYGAAAHARTDRRAVLGGVLLLLAGIVGLLTTIQQTAPTDYPLAAWVIGVGWSAGWYVRGSAIGQRQVRRADADEEAAAPARRRAVLEAERRRVARELHDVVAHGVSLVGILAGAARTVAATDPARARAVIGDLEEALAGTRVELARLLDALRTGDEPAEDAASIADLDVLLARSRSAGQHVLADIDCDAVRGAAYGVVASVVRIVQESLTNARKHAPGATATVRVAGSRGALVVEVRNAPAAVEPAAPGARRGIEGMRERARLLGGELEADPLPDGGFRVRARLPLEARDAAAA